MTPGGGIPEKSPAAVFVASDEPVKRRSVDHIMIRLRMMGRAERNKISVVEPTREIFLERRDMMHRQIHRVVFPHRSRQFIQTSLTQIAVASENSFRGLSPCG